MKTIWVILISCIATAVIIGGGTYYFVNAKATKDKDDLQTQITNLNKKISDTEAALVAAEDTSSTSTTATDTSTVGTTSSSAATSPTTSTTKTYTNTTLGISFQYPSDYYAGSYTFDGQSGVAVSNHSDSDKYFGTNPAATAPTDMVHVYILPNTPGGSDSSITSNSTINGLTVYNLLDNLTTGDSTVKSKYAKFKIGSTNYYLDISFTKTRAAAQSSISLFDQIVSSFSITK